MIVRLACLKCALDSSKLLDSHESVTIDVPTPISRIADDAIYHVVCERKHHTRVVLMNQKFELLFEMGLNSIIDENYRDAVSSFISSLERFYEFFWRVTLTHFSIGEKEIELAWKNMSNQSERQLGAYISASLLLNKRNPPLLKNKEINLRNKVIHKGYITLRDEAIGFGDEIKILLETELENLRSLAQDSLMKVYERSIPKIDKKERDDEEAILKLNVITTIDIKCPRTDPKDSRRGVVSQQFERILRERQPHEMILLSNEEAVQKNYQSTKHDSYLL